MFASFFVLAGGSGQDNILTLQTGPCRRRLKGTAVRFISQRVNALGQPAGR